MPKHVDDHDMRIAGVIGHYQTQMLLQTLRLLVRLSANHLSMV